MTTVWRHHPIVCRQLHARCLAIYCGTASVLTAAIRPSEALIRKMHTVRQFVDRDAPLLQRIVPLAIASSLFLDFRLPIRPASYHLR
jgi:hypothetical protein